MLSSSGQLDNLMSERSERVRYRVEHEKIKFISISEYVIFYEFLVFKETVVLRRWERSKQKFGFIKRVDKG